MWANRLRLVSLVVIGFALAGCTPSQSDLDKSIREGMKSQLNVDVQALTLTKNADGSYSGSLAATNGDHYDITTEKPSGGKIKWKAVPGQAVFERVIREGMQSKAGVTVKSFDLQKIGEGEYAGTMTADNGDAYEVTASRRDGTNIEWKAVPGQAAIERIVKTGIEEQTKLKVKALTLKRGEGFTYSGVAELENGQKMKVTAGLDEKLELSWKAEPVK